MSTIERTSTPNAATRKPRITIAQLVLRAVGRWQRSRAINELSLLDDRQLDDIGISRNDIPRVVEGLFSSEECHARTLPKAVASADNMVAVASYSRAA